MSDHQGHRKEIKDQGTLSRDSKRMKRRTYRKVVRLFELGLLKLKKMTVEEIDNNAVLLFTEVTKCRLCSQFLVMTARNSCCEPCLIKWMNEDDPDDEIIKCRMCNTPIKAVLSGRELKLFYELVEFNDKKISSNGHFGYPVLGKVVMYQLFVDLERNLDFADERIQKP
ncbi:uncharacterized protein LOC100575341 [Acyrthosiphon pisum]|uniref:Uncharacterized protein n=1 Tax=Acyrthosiphon pisum TaxID=7029 RepID=A0A8R1W5G4_ACYPI|nr:uncharacterized protein LOC100575341 [Acyrthosiphon pisum]|eukprot:XP_003244252.1 PREDICTED: uncharacterized protein LOC100575341 [Acyrthosiphon pisum]